VGESVKRILWWLIAGTRGGETRARIIKALKKRPYNANQLAELLGLDYKTIRHHLDVLHENEMIISTGRGYGKIFHLSPFMEENYDAFEEIWKEIGNKLKTGKTKN
jgi:DNA-binding transcriptional ArsR family regulator